MRLGAPLAVVLIAAVAVAQEAPRGAAITTPARAGQLRVVELRGTARQRGVEHGEELRQEIHALLGAWRRDLEKTYSIKSRDFVTRFLARTEFRKAIERWTPGLLEEVRGIAEGADVDFDTMLAFQLIDEVWAQGAIAGHKCTSIGVDRRGDQPTIVAQNLDLPPWMHAFPTLLRVHEDTGVQSLVATLPGLVGANGVNNRRIAVAVNTLMQLRPAVDGLPVAFVVRGILMQPDHASAVAFVEKVRHASGQNYIVGGPDVAPAFECSAGKKVRFAPFEGAAHTYHTNHPLVNDDWAPNYLARIEEMGRTPRQGTRTCHRFAALRERLARGVDVDRDVVTAALRSRDHARDVICNPWTYLCTIAVLGEQPEFHVAIGRPDRAAFRVLRFGGE